MGCSTTTILAQLSSEPDAGAGAVHTISPGGMRPAGTGLLAGEYEPGDLWGDFRGAPLGQRTADYAAARALALPNSEPTRFGAKMI
jgi:hypothetical protein